MINHDKAQGGKEKNKKVIDSEHNKAKEKYTESREGGTREESAVGESSKKSQR